MADEFPDNWRPPNFQEKPTSSIPDDDPTLDKRQALDGCRTGIMSPPTRKSSPERIETTDRGDSRFSMSKTTGLSTTVDPRKSKQPHLHSNPTKIQPIPSIVPSATRTETTALGHNNTNDADHDDTKRVLANAFAADHAFNRLQDRRTALEKDLKIYQRELADAVRFPHQVLREQVQTKIKQNESLLNTTQNDFNEASKKRDLCLQLVSEKLVGTPGKHSGNVVSETSLHELRQQIEQERQDRIAQNLAFATQLRDLKNLIIEQRQPSESLGLTGEDISKRMRSLELSLESHSQTITKLQNPTDSVTMNDIRTMDNRIEAMSEEMKSRMAQKFLKHSDLDIYIDNFERFKSTTLQRIIDTEKRNEKLATELQQLQNSQSVIQALTKNLATLSYEFSQQQKNKSTASLADADRQALEEATSLVHSLNSLIRQIQELRENALRTNHSILALHDKCDKMTTEHLYQKVAQMVSPSLEDIRNTIDTTSKAMKALDKKSADLNTQVEEVGKGLSVSIATSSDIKSQLSEVQRSFDVLKQDTGRLGQQAADEKSSDKVNALLQDLAAMQKQVSSLEDQVRDSQAQIQAVPGTVQNNHQVCLANNSKLIADVKAAKQLLEGRIVALEQATVTADNTQARRPLQVAGFVNGNDQADNTNPVLTQSITTSDEGNIKGTLTFLSSATAGTSKKNSSEDSAQKKSKKNKHKKRMRNDSSHTIVAKDALHPHKRLKIKQAEPIDLTMYDDSDSIDDLLADNDADGPDAEEVEALLRKFKKPAENQSQNHTSEQKKKKPSKHFRQR